MKVLYTIDHLKWSNFVYHHPNGNIFQTPEMYEVYRNTKNYEPVFLAVVSEDNEILGILLSVIQREYRGTVGNLTARAIVWGGPLIKNNNRQVLSLILNKYNKIGGQKAIFTQVRNLWDVSDNIDVFTHYGYQYSEHLNFIIDLSIGKNRLFSNLSPSKRRQIRRVREKKNVEILNTEDENDVIEFYKILSFYYSTHIKKPVPPLEFFLNILRILVKKSLAKVFVIKYNEEIIGGIVCPISYNCSKKTIYELYICGSRKHNNLFPSVMATWAPIEWGSENKIDYFDFMGAGKPNVDYGVREFKAKFGGKLVNYGRFEKVHKPIKFKIAKAGFKLWRKLKK